MCFRACVCVRVRVCVYVYVCAQFSAICWLCFHAHLSAFCLVCFCRLFFFFFFFGFSPPASLCCFLFVFLFWGVWAKPKKRPSNNSPASKHHTLERKQAPHTLACVVFELLAVEQHGNFSWPHGMVDTVANARALKMHVCNTRFSVTWPFCSVTTHTTTQQGKKKTRKPRGSSCLCVVLDGHVTTCTFSIACLAVACCCCCCFCLPPLSLLSTLTNHG